MVAHLTGSITDSPSFPQLTQALSGRFNSHVHVEYEWRLLHEDLDESDDDVDEKLQVSAIPWGARSIEMSFARSLVDPGLESGHRVVLFKK